MKDLGIQSIPVSEIDDTQRLRPVDSAWVAALAENIAQIGRLRQPIEVRKLRKGYRLVAGGHRLAAVRALGWTEIAATVLDCSDDEARLAEIDENLVRHELNPLDRAVFLAERKTVYEKLHPDTKAGVAGGKSRQGAATDIMSFAADTAERIGLTDRTIRRSILIYTKLSPEVRKSIGGTWLAQHQSELLALAKLPPVEQQEVIGALLGPLPRAKSVQAAHRLIYGQGVEPDADNQTFEKLYSAWGRAGARAKRAFLARLAEDGDLERFGPRGEV